MAAAGDKRMAETALEVQPPAAKKARQNEPTAEMRAFEEKIWERAANTSEFQRLLLEKNASEVVGFLARVGQENIDFTRNCHPRTFKSYVWHVICIPCTDEEFLVLLNLLHSVGLLTSKELCVPWDVDGVLATPLQYAAGLDCPFLYDYLRKTVDLSSMPMGLVLPENGNSPLTHLLRINAYDDGSKKLLTNEMQRDYDRRSAEIIDLVPDESLNVANSDGLPPVVLAVINCRVSTLRALIRRLPAVDLYPEYRFVSNGPPSTSIDSALKIMSSNGKSEPIWAETRELVALGRAHVQMYSDDMQKVLGAFVIITKVVAEIIFQYARPNPYPVVSALVAAVQVD